MPSSYCRMVGEFTVRLAPLGHSLHRLASMQVKLTSSNLFSGFYAVVEVLAFGIANGSALHRCNARIAHLPRLHTAPSHTPKVLLTVCRRVRNW